MLYVIEAAGPEEAKAHAEKWGRYNDVPPNWREVTEAAIASDQRIGMYAPLGTEHRQMRIDTGCYRDVRLWFLPDGTGYATLAEVVTPPVSPSTPAGVATATLDRLRWFRFGCDHSMKELGYDECQKRNFRHEGRCWHVLECENCGFIEQHDSSD